MFFPSIQPRSLSPSLNASSDGGGPELRAEVTNPRHFLRLLSLGCRAKRKERGAKREYRDAFLHVFSLNSIHLSH